jgi:ABC-type multidrug transport system ATPase subunit
MHIQLKNISKNYNQDWIFNDLNHEFPPNSSTAILGANGSGKSSLLKMIAGYIIPSKGSITYNNESGIQSPENIFRFVSIAAPYLELIEEFTLLEMLSFHFKFKPFLNAMNPGSLIDLMEFGKERNKVIKNFSSGMKQRVRLALAILSDTAILLLDEPISNLDKKGIEWYNQLITGYSRNRITIVCSNQQIQEYSFCETILNMGDFKKNC